MKKYFVSLLILTSSIVCHEQTNSPLNIAIIGLGGRAQSLLRECLKQNPAVRVLAICDDRAKECLLSHETVKLAQSPLLPAYRTAVRDAALYPNTQEGLKRLFAEHSNIDVVLITSPNYDHCWHLNTVLEYAADKKIFMEKPIFKNLDEFTSFDFDQTKDKSIIIGLTLRYSSMARIVAQQLQAHQQNLGALQHVKAWERLNFGHAFTAFIMGWRRYINLSGGLLLEKCVHDLDLSLYFIDALGIHSHEITISTYTENRFFLTSRKPELLDFVMHNETFHKNSFFVKAAQWQNHSWNPGNFLRNEVGAIDWQKSLDSILAEYPEDDNFSGLNIIPDYHKLSAMLKTAQGDVGFELEVDLGGFRPKTERGQLFTFEHGTVLIDIIASKMIITCNDGTEYEYDLQTNNTDHADGDEYIVRSILGRPLPNGYSMATLNDPIVKLANLMGLVSEHQALHGLEEIILKNTGINWGDQIKNTRKVE